MYLYQKPRLSRVSLFLLRAWMALGGFFAVFIVLAFFLAGEIYDYQDSVARGGLPPVDAIVCLAGGRGRISLAADVWLQYWETAQTQSVPQSGGGVPTLYLAGMGPQAHWGQVAKQFRPQVQKVILPENVLIENESSNTVANAVWLADYAKKHHWRHILLMTSTYHMKRAQLIFHRVLVNRPDGIELDTLSVFQDPFSAYHWRHESIGVRVTLLEYVKWLYYSLIWSGD